MKYQATTQEHHEGGMTAKLMYDVIDTLINRHISSEDIVNARNALSENILDYDSVNLWHKPWIRSELEEFVKSYFFSDLNEQLPGFEGVFIRNYIKQEGETDREFSTRRRAKQRERLETYMDVLEQEYGSTDEAYRVISEVFDRIIKRKDRIFEASRDVMDVKRDSLIEVNSNEAFRPISFYIYGWIENAIHDIGIPPQS